MKTIGFPPHPIPPKASEDGPSRLCAFMVSQRPDFTKQWKSGRPVTVWSSKTPADCCMSSTLPPGVFVQYRSGRPLPSKSPTANVSP